MKAFSKVTVAANMAFAAAISFFGCSSDDSSDPSTGGGGDGGNIESVTIGSQVWMKKNLDVAGGKCYNDLPANCETYGSLYDWATSMGFPESCNTSECAGQIKAKHKGICPNGWHIPSNEEWDKLFRYVDGTNGTDSPYNSETAGKHLKATSGWNSSGNGDNASGFAALPGGIYRDDFEDIGYNGMWWTASENSTIRANSRYMYYDSDDAKALYSMKYNLRSVRCIKD